MAYYIEAYFAGTALVDVTPLAIQEFLKSLTDREYASRTVRAHLDTLHQALDTAVQWHLLPRNPADHAASPRVIYRDQHPLTAPASSEVQTPGASQASHTLQAFLDAATLDPQYALWLTLLGTGLRLGEALGLFWADIDWDQHSLVLQRTLSPLGMLRPSKAHAQRRVTIPDTVIVMLRHHRIAQRTWQEQTPAGPGDPDYVFTTRTGRPLSAASVRRTMRRLGALAHIPAPLTPHDLRHLYATMMRERDGHLTIVQRPSIPTSATACKTQRERP